MSALAALVKAVHLGALALLLGAFTFLLFVARPAFARAPAGLHKEQTALDRRVMRLAMASLVVSLATTLAWLWIQAAVVTGRSLGQALAADALIGVLTGTQFGRVQHLRLWVLVTLGALLWLREREADDRDWIALRLDGAVLGGAVVAVLSWVGHAGATEGREGVVHLVANSLHLLAAGTWLGGLVPLSLLLVRAPTGSLVALTPVISDAVRRFSMLGLVCVVTLVLTGLVNSWILVGTLPALVGTSYGRLLLLKIVLLLPLLAIAAVNRSRLTPRPIPGRSPSDEKVLPLLRHLRRNVFAEAALGSAILLVVGLLGVTPPARHVQPSWPFSVRLSWEANKDRPDIQFAMIAAGIAILCGLVAVGYGAFRRPRRKWAIAVGAVVIGYYSLTPLQYLSIDAYPTTYVRSSVPYSAVSVAGGARLYATHCAACHGVDGYGDGPAGQALPTRPANLTAKHTAEHTAGDLFWWLTHGIRGTAMPGFKDRLSEEDRWDLINFLRALAAAEQARLMGSIVEPGPWLVAPDFAFGTGVGQPETLKEQRGWAMVHLVLFTLPASLPRLEELDRAWTTIGLAGARVIAVPMREADDVYRRLGLRVLNIPIGVDGSPEIAATYALFRRTWGADAVPPVPSHLEFLIDRQGYIRARWAPTEGAGWMDVGGLLREVERLDKEAPGAPAPDEHVH